MSVLSRSVTWGDEQSGGTHSLQYINCQQACSRHQAPGLRPIGRLWWRGKENNLSRKGSTHTHFPIHVVAHAVARIGVVVQS